VLTKRSERLAELAPRLPWPNNVGWSERRDARVIPASLTCRACRPRLRFMSLEPLIGPLDALPLEGIHWHRRRGIGTQGAPAEKRVGHFDFPPVPRRSRAFFFKQWGGVRKDLTGRELNADLQRDARDTAAGLGIAKHQRFRG